MTVGDRRGHQHPLSVKGVSRQEPPGSWVLMFSTCPSQETSKFSRCNRHLQGAAYLPSHSASRRGDVAKR